LSILIIYPSLLPSGGKGIQIGLKDEDEEEDSGTQGVLKSIPLY